MECRRPEDGTEQIRIHTSWQTLEDLTRRDRDSQAPATRDSGPLFWPLPQNQKFFLDPSMLSFQSPSSEILVEYHQCMDAQMYEKYMKTFLPLIAAAAPVGRQPILVIDNASIHNTLVAKVVN
uniref:Tc1-like transposase DDE domain-containing protein n=1 Tax=Caenorhabditis japonica TaxID=281687 RepID=A0A8R1IDM8_CAEJA